MTDATNRISAPPSSWPPGLTVAEFFAQVERIANSPAWSTSESARALLRYLAQQSVASPDHTPKEHEIAVNVLGRPADFDPKLDPIVRVRTSRLRSKLAEYYVAEGAHDSIYLEAPKGAYCILPTLRLDTAVQPPPPPKSSRRPLWPGLAILPVIAFASWFYLRSPSPPAALEHLWLPFFSRSSETLVVFANPKFVGTSSNGLHLFDPTRDQGQTINGGYTGSGEVAATYSLTRLFLTFHSELRFKRAQLFTWDDARTRNLIFLGAGPHNLPVLQFPIGQQVRIKPFDASPYPGQGCVENIHPQPGEPQFYCGKSDNGTDTEYAIVTFQQTPDSAHFIAVFAGQTTFGTQAAVEFFTDPTQAQALTQRLGQAHAFEAVLRVTLRSLSPVSSELVLLRPSTR